MIKYNLNTINDWFFSTDNIIKVYRNNAICYYKIDSSSPSGQTPCFAVVDDITQYSDTEFEDVFNKADEKWYKLNNLNQYEEYGVYGSGRTITTYEGKLTIDTESTPQPSRLPQGYTEVEYIRQNSNYNAYINTGVIIFDNTTNTYTITTRLTSEFHSNLGCATIINCERVNSPYDGLGYRYKCSSTVNQLEFFGGNPNYTSSVVDNGDGTKTVTFQSSGNSSFTTDVPLSYLASFSSTTYGTNSTYRYSDATIYSSTIVKNGVTVRDFVPAKRDSDSVYGLYDLITDTFYTSPNGNNFSGGSEVTPPPITTTCEFIYSGNSWVNVGEVSGGTIDTVWLDPNNTGSLNPSYQIGHYWGEGYKMIYTLYINGSYSTDTGSFWRWNQQTPIEFNFYSNGFYYDFHNPTSTTSPSVYTGDSSWRIMKNGTLRNYESGQVMLVTLTNGTVNVELESTGTLITSGSTTVTAQNWYNGLYQAYIGAWVNGNKVHIKEIQVYDANDVLVNDLTFVKNNGVTGAQEISMYDSVLNVTYNNTTENTPTYHIVEESGGTTYPVYYDELQDPPDNLSFSSMAEAEAYECPWVGMRATIDGVRYVFSGDSQSGYEWVYNSSRLPQGYTEVEYITSENISTSVSGPYIDTNFTPNQTTRVVMDYQPMVNGQTNRRIFGSGEFNSTGYVWNMEGTLGETSCYYYYKFGAGSSWYTTSINPDLNRHTVDFNNNGQILLDNTSIATLPNNTFTCTYHLGLFRSIFNQYTTYNICLLGRVYSCQVYDNGTLVRDFVPCINPSNAVGMYDIVNDVFYTTANASYQFTAGNPV